LTEAELLAEVTKRCDQLGLLHHHCRDSRYCDGNRGWPDLVIVGPQGVLFRELKSEDGRASRAQLRYIRQLRELWDAALWRPEDLDSGRIARELEEIT